MIQRIRTTVKRIRTYTIGILFGGIIVTLLAGTAGAMWTAIGSGEGSADTATLVGVAFFDPTGTPDTLFPGGTADLLVKVKNENTLPVKVVGVAAGTAATATDPTNCNPSGVSFKALDPTVLANLGTTTISPNATVELTLIDAAQMDLSAPNGCQNKFFNVPVVLTVQTVAS